jgi:hypothetical protein
MVADLAGLFPLNRSGRVAGDVEDAAVNTFDFVDDLAGS